jgi:hypothetical protein
MSSPKTLIYPTYLIYLFFLGSNLAFFAILFTTGALYKTYPLMTPSRIQLMLIKNLGPISYKSIFYFYLLTTSLKI